MGKSDALEVGTCSANRFAPSNTETLNKLKHGPWNLSKLSFQQEGMERCRT